MRCPEQLRLPLSVLKCGVKCRDCYRDKPMNEKHGYAVLTRPFPTRTSDNGTASTDISVKKTNGSDRVPEARFHANVSSRTLFASLTKHLSV